VQQTNAVWLNEAYYFTTVVTLLNTSL